MTSADLTKIVAAVEAGFEARQADLERFIIGRVAYEVKQQLLAHYLEPTVRNAVQQAVRDRVGIRLEFKPGFFENKEG